MTRFLAIALAATMAACAGRDPQPIATVQMTDANASCAMITAEIQANNIKVQELAGEGRRQGGAERRSWRRWAADPGPMVRDGLQGRSKQGSRRAASPATIFDDAGG